MSLACLKHISIFLVVSFGYTILASEDIPDDIIPILYLKYKEAVDDAPNENMVSLRRISNNNKEYKIHVKKLKAVNGLKRHNLVLRTESEAKTMIYVNNPVETNIPNAYLSLDEFKKLLTNRARKDRDKFKKYSKTETYIKPTRTIFNIIHVDHNNYDKPKNIENTQINELNHKIINENTPIVFKLKHKTTPRTAPSRITIKATVLKNNTHRTIDNIETKISKTTATKKLTTKSYRNTVDTTTSQKAKDPKTETTLQTLEAKKNTTYNIPNINYPTEVPTELHSLMTDNQVDLQTNAPFKTTTAETFPAVETKDFTTDNITSLKVPTEAPTELHSLMTDNQVDLQTNASFEMTTAKTFPAVETKDFTTDNITSLKVPTEAPTELDSLMTDNHEDLQTNAPFDTSTGITTEVEALSTSTLRRGPKRSTATTETTTDSETTTDTETTTTTTTTTTKPTRKKLSRPLVFMGGLQ